MVLKDGPLTIDAHAHAEAVEVGLPHKAAVRGGALCGAGILGGGEVDECEYRQ
jgi:hypothetical protein